MKSYKKPYRYHTGISLAALVVSLVATTAGLSLHSPQYISFFLFMTVLFVCSSILSFFWWDRPREKENAEEKPQPSPAQNKQPS